MYCKHCGTHISYEMRVVFGTCAECAIKHNIGVNRVVTVQIIRRETGESVHNLKGLSLEELRMKAIFALS